MVNEFWCFYFAVSIKRNCYLMRVTEYSDESSAPLGIVEQHLAAKLITQQLAIAEKPQASFSARVSE
jgi:hypothetical protein